MSSIECYRFVTDDLRSANGNSAWRIGEWNSARGSIVASVNGLHASLTPRDSLRNVYGQRWFRAEARGETDHLDGKFAASEMRLVEEIPSIVLRRFAVVAATESLHKLEERHPVDPRLLRCVETTQRYLDGSVSLVELEEARESATDVVGPESAIGPDTARATAATLAATHAAEGGPGLWAAAAAEAALAALKAAEAIDAATALVTAQTGIHNVAKGFAAARVASLAAEAARDSAAAGAVAHAAAVAAARGEYTPDTAADRFFAAWSAVTNFPAGEHYAAQSSRLLGLVNDPPIGSGLSH